MSIQDFIDYLNEHINENAILDLNGIISFKIQIINFTFKYTKDKLVLSGENFTIEFNLHQLMKITIITNNQFLLEFDQLQNINIAINNKLLHK